MTALYIISEAGIKYNKLITHIIINELCFLKLFVLLIKKRGGMLKRIIIFSILIFFE